MPRSGLAAVATVGDRLATLRAMRDLLAGEIDDCASKRDMAALTQRMLDVLQQIEDAEKETPEQKGTALDELAAKRNTKTKGSADASRLAHPAGKKRGS